MKETFVFTPEDWQDFVEAIEKYWESSRIVCDYIIGETGGYPEKMTEEQRAADLALSHMDASFSQLKELGYYMLKCQPDSTYHLNLSIDAALAGESEYKGPSLIVEK